MSLTKFTSTNNRPWKLARDETPVGVWLETRRKGEKGTNICMCLIDTLGSEPRWVERETGRDTLANGGSFAAPTHWRLPKIKGLNKFGAAHVRVHAHYDSTGTAMGYEMLDGPYQGKQYSYGVPMHAIIKDLPAKAFTDGAEFAISARLLKLGDRARNPFRKSN